MQTIRKAASSASGGGGMVGRELLRRLRLRPLPNDAAAAPAANGGERSAATLSSSSTITTRNNNNETQYPGRGASLLAHAAATGTSVSASAFALQQALHVPLLVRHYSTSSPAVGSRGRSARRGNDKRTRKRRKKSGSGSGSSSGGSSRRGGNKPLLRGGRRGGGGGGGGGGGNRLDLLPLPSAGGSSAKYDAFGALSSAKGEHEALYRYDGDMGDDDFDDFDGERRLYYYQTPDEADEANGGGIGDVPPTILSKMESDPTYFHGMEGLALQWTTPSTDPPSRDIRVQAVLRDIIQRQELAAARSKKKGRDAKDGGWNGKVVVRIPKLGVNVDESDNGAIEDHDIVGNGDEDEEVEHQDHVGTNNDDDDEHQNVTVVDKTTPRRIAMVEVASSPIDANNGAEADSVSKASVPEMARTLSKTSEKRLAELEHFKEANGHLNVPHMGETKSLYHWLNNKKKAYDDLLNGGESSATTLGTITQEEIDKLEQMGIDWTVPTYSTSESRLADLARFKEKHGHLNVPRYGDEYSALYKWLYSRKVQRDDFLAGEKVSLSQEEFDRLNELGLDWSVGGKRSGYNVFVKHRSEEMRQFNADLSPREVRERVLSEWREMTDEKKLVWKAKAEAMLS